MTFPRFIMTFYILVLSNCGYSVFSRGGIALKSYIWQILLNPDNLADCETYVYQIIITRCHRIFLNSSVNALRFLYDLNVFLKDLICCQPFQVLGEFRRLDWKWTFLGYLGDFKSSDHPVGIPLFCTNIQRSCWTKDRQITWKVDPSSQVHWWRNKRNHQELYPTTSRNWILVGSIPAWGGLW